jgi:hypothetical protein
VYFCLVALGAAGAGVAAGAGIAAGAGVAADAGVLATTVPTCGSGTPIIYSIDVHIQHQRFCFGRQATNTNLAWLDANGHSKGHLAAGTKIALWDSRLQPLARTDAGRALDLEATAFKHAVELVLRYNAARLCHFIALLCVCVCGWWGCTGSYSDTGFGVFAESWALHPSPSGS